MVKRLNLGLVGGALLVIGAGSAVAAGVRDPALVDGMHASLTVKGMMVESACTLEMASQDQTVSLGVMTRGELSTFGAQAAPIVFQLRLRDCGHWDGAIRDGRHSGNLTRLPGQQSVFVTFSSELQRGGLVRIKGEARGIGLRLEDGRHRQLRLGEQSEAQILTPGDNRLTFYVIAERTAEPLILGRFYAVVNFRLSYD